MSPTVSAAEKQYLQSLDMVWMVAWLLYQLPALFVLQLECHQLLLLAKAIAATAADSWCSCCIYIQVLYLPNGLQHFTGRACAPAFWVREA